MFLVELLAPALMLGKESHARLSHVALTANLGMYEFQDQWANQAGPLSDEQKQQVRRHPEVSVERLKALGVDDPIWFGIVRQHHERADGSGYPLGLSGDKVLREALVLGMIDRYLSFVMPRANRKWTHPTAALKIIYEDASAYGSEHINTFIQQLGVYPPGTSVRLINGEIAVVINHEIGKSAHPRVMSVINAGGIPLGRPIERDSAEPDSRIKGLYLPDPAREANPATLVNCWT
jgi:HD-GYP domain-containing protein (c-di-GMP phosphodiesterase class II)